MQNTKSNFQSIFSSFINQPKATLADEYIRANELIDVLENYFIFNIDEFAGLEVHDMTLAELRNILELKISNYKNFRRNEYGTFSEEEPVTKWLREGAIKRNLKPLLKD